MFNINVIREETSIAAAGDWNDDDYVDAPTKAIIFELKALSNGGAQTVSDVVAQFGSVLQVKDKVQGLIADYGQVADLFYYEWYRQGHAPKIEGHVTDNDVINATLAVWFGDPRNPHQGLHARGLTTKLTSPASANEIDTETLSIYQLIQPTAHYTEFMKHEKVDFTPTSGGWKKLPLYCSPLSRKIMLALLYQTTCSDDVATTSAYSVDKIELWKDGAAGIKEFYADFLVDLFAPTTQNLYSADHTFLSNYIPFDFVKLNNGYPYIPSREGVARKLEFNIKGGDANAVRLNQYSLMATG